MGFVAVMTLCLNFLKKSMQIEIDRCSSFRKCCPIWSANRDDLTRFART